MKATITLTLDEAALEAWLAKVYSSEGRPTSNLPDRQKKRSTPTVREHVEEHLDGFINDELNNALWHDYTRKAPPVITRVELAIDGEEVLDADWSVWETPGETI